MFTADEVRKLYEEITSRRRRAYSDLINRRSEMVAFEVKYGQDEENDRSALRKLQADCIHEGAKVQPSGHTRKVDHFFCPDCGLVRLQERPNQPQKAVDGPSAN